MDFRPKQMPSDIQGLIQQQASFISAAQLPSGAIPWYQGGITDPWDHVECAIALDLAGRFDQAARAYRWLRDSQNPDGSWWFSYLDGQPHDLTRDTNHSSYLAVGLWYHYLATGDADFLGRMWPVLEKGVTFALDLQQPTGEIYWGCGPSGVAWPGALLASSSSVWQSLNCGMRIAGILGLSRPDWEAAGRRLAGAIRQHPELFDNSRHSRQDFAMDWYYPVLSGVITGRQARERILGRWPDFVIDDWGCKCIVETPWWVTVAETCELVLALTRIGEHSRARQLLDWILRLQDSDGNFWTGIKIPEEEIWPPGQKPTWVSAAVIMAVMAQFEDTSAASFRFV